ncbi:GRB2-associated-binding protein 4 [Castor canadensis]|uniref:GRB2-associated-binding protein 4 n=1 Tax=Castor canadensis TaxID=51338 RepID=A0AC58LTW3_CASCN
MDGSDVMCSGWLRKSPPEKKLRFCVSADTGKRGPQLGAPGEAGTAWRKRWFILRRGQTCDDPDVLEYYKNDQSKKPLRSINLSLCERMDAGVTLHNMRLPAGFVFDIQTTERTFYLVAETKEDMNNWVQSICQICGFRQDMGSTAFECKHDTVVCTQWQLSSEKGLMVSVEGAEKTNPAYHSYLGVKGKQLQSVGKAPVLKSTVCSEAQLPPPYWPRRKQGENESPSLDEACRVRPLEVGTLEKLVNHLVPSMQSADPFFVPAFLCAYRRFATTQQVLELLFRRYGFFHPDCEEDEQVKKAICSILRTWLDKYPEDFCQSMDLACLNQLMAYVLLNMPFTELAVPVDLLLTQLEDRKSSEVEPKSQEALGGYLRVKPVPQDLHSKAILEQPPCRSASATSEPLNPSYSQDCRPRVKPRIRSTDPQDSKGQRQKATSPAAKRDFGPAPRRDPSDVNYAVLDFPPSSPSHGRKPSSSSLSSSERAEYAVVDWVKTRGLQRTIEEWTAVRQSQALTRAPSHDEARIQGEPFNCPLCLDLGGSGSGSSSGTLAKGA